jgi:hypothetical protein
MEVVSAIIGTVLAVLFVLVIGPVGVTVTLILWMGLAFAATASLAR